MLRTAFYKCLLADLNIFSTGSQMQTKSCIQTASATHYANKPMQYTAIFNGCKDVTFQMKKSIYLKH